jgi:hypothetical protein
MVSDVLRWVTPDPTSSSPNAKEPISPASASDSFVSYKDSKDSSPTSPTSPTRRRVQWADEKKIVSVRSSTWKNTQTQLETLKHIRLARQAAAQVENMQRDITLPVEGLYLL